MNDAVATLTKDVNSLRRSLAAWLSQMLTWDHFFRFLGVLLVLLIYFVIFKSVSHGIKKIKSEKFTEDRKAIVLRIVKYLYFFAICIYILELFGIKLSTIWGAAGIAGIAVGFAAQTSVSNIISGLFIVSEKTIKLGDTIIIDNITGVVDAISLLSIRVHTHDNQMVRIPNSSIINSTFINNSYNSYRRLTIRVSVSYNTDLNFALETLSKAPALCPAARTDPAAAVWIDQFADSGIEIVMAIWFNNEDFIATKNQAFTAIKKVFDEAKIEIPFNQIVVRTAE